MNIGRGLLGERVYFGRGRELKAVPGKVVGAYFDVEAKEAVLLVSVLVGPAGCCTEVLRCWPVNTVAFKPLPAQGSGDADGWLPVNTDGEY